MRDAVPVALVGIPVLALFSFVAVLVHPIFGAMVIGVWIAWTVAAFVVWSLEVAEHAREHVEAIEKIHRKANR